MKTAPAPEHWLIRTAKQLGLKLPDALKVHSKTPAEEAWALVCQSSGLSDSDLARRVAAHFRLETADIRSAEERTLKLVPERLALQFHVFPLRERQKQLTVATSDPTNLAAEQAIAFCCGRRIVFEIASPTQIREAIAAGYAPDQMAENMLRRVSTDLLDAIRVVQSLSPETISVREVEKAPVVKLTNLILHDAIAARASDVHIEPEVKGGVVRMRIDGVLQSYMQMPRPVLDRVVSRIKVMGNMDMSDRLRPQSGRSHIEAGGIEYDLRISTVPTRQSEKAVVRMLGSGRSETLQDLLLPEAEMKRLRQLFSYRDGLVVVTGPTGSGKTTTLYAGLRELTTGKINIMTVEDPVEYELSGVTQIQVAPRQGLTFATTLRTILRQDPDVILVGEIRDLETAEIAVQASMTGHLVLTTLHTNDAVGVVPRLATLGLSKNVISSVLRGVVAQRLVRRLCPKCAVKAVTPRTEETVLAERYGVQPQMRAAGCEHCAHSGYRGRIPLMEIFIPTPSLQKAINDGSSNEELNRSAVESGMRPLIKWGIHHVETGDTTLEEIDRVLGLPAASDVAKPEQAHILVVDSDTATRKHARTLLERNGYRVTEAGNGEGAIKTIEKGEGYAMALVASDMPLMSGSQLLSRLKSSLATAGLPVVMLMAPGGGSAEPSLMEAGADDCIEKPLDPADFIARVAGCLRRASAYQSTAETQSDLGALLQTTQPSIAVLPFADMSQAHDQGYLCEGLAEELTDTLTRLDGLRVAARTSAFRFRSEGQDVREIGRVLGVSSVLEGSIRKSGDVSRISVHLVNTEDGYEFWSERFERKLGEGFEVQDEISRAIVDKLKVVLLGGAADVIADKPHTTTEVHDLYLKGRHQWNKRTEESLKNSVAHFKQAIERDANYAPAYAGLADSYVTMSIYGAASPGDVMPLAMEAADRSLALDAKSAVALNALGCVRAMYVWDWDAETDFKRAIELDPNNPMVHQWYAGNYLMPLSRFAEARREIRLALQLDPMSLAANVTAGALSYYERRYDDAVDLLLKAAELDPSFGVTQYFLGQTHTERGAYGDAISALRRAEKLAVKSPEILAALGYALARDGQTDAARATLATLSELATQRYISPVLLSQVEIGLGDKAGALEHLQEAFKVRATDLVWIAVKPVFDDLRQDHEFAELSSQIFLIG